MSLFGVSKKYCDKSFFILDRDIGNIALRLYALEVKKMPSHTKKERKKKSKKR